MKQINEIDLNSYRDRVYQNAVNHGWHEEKKSDEHWMCLVISELMEAVEADRVGNYADIEAFEKNEMRELDFRENFERYIKDTVQDELADACIRLLDLAGLRDLDLSGIRTDEFESAEGFFNWTFTESMYYIVSVIAEKGIMDWKDFRGYLYTCLGEIMTYCVQHEIDIFWFIEQKMKYNESRPFKHGGKKY